MITIPGRRRTTQFSPQPGSLAKPAEISLYPGFLYTLRIQKHPVRISLHTGMVFITQEADSRDHILNPGEQITLTHKGRAIIEAFSPSEFTRSPANRR